MKDCENAPHEGKRRVLLFLIRMKIIGIYLNYIIKDLDIFMNYFIKKKRSQKNYIIIA